MPFWQRGTNGSKKMVQMPNPPRGDLAEIPRCSALEACEELREILSELGAPHDAVMSVCDSDESEVWPCTAFLENARLLYSLVSLDNAKSAVAFIASLFPNRASMLSEKFNPLADQTPFSCPELGVEIYQPCRVSSCAFHTENDWTRNCILYYRLRQGRELLNLNELSFLTQIEVGSLRTIINKTLKGLGHGALKESIAQEQFDKRVKYLLTENICVVCEGKAQSKKASLVKSGFYYCSRDCYKRKPPNVIRLEREFELPIEQLLHMCVQKFSSVKNMCNALGVGQSVFTALCARYSVDIPSDK